MFSRPINLDQIKVTAPVRTAALAVIYATVLILSRWLAYQLRFDFQVPALFENNCNSGWLLPVGIEMVLLMIFGQFSGIIRYFSLPDARRLLYATSIALIFRLAVRAFGTEDLFAPRGVIIIDFVLSTCGLVAVRMGFRILSRRLRKNLSNRGQPVRRVGIIGAGDAGAALARELQERPERCLVPVAFFDDDEAKWHSRLHDIPIIGSPESLRRKQDLLMLDSVIIAMPTASGKRIRDIVNLVTGLNIRCETIPSLMQLAIGEVRISQTRPVDIVDLLGRDPVELNLDQIHYMIAGKVVAVTGAGGSIGSELCRQIAASRPSKLLLIEQSEVQLFQIEQELVRADYGKIVVPLVADILDATRIKALLQQHRPQLLFHAAAHKHVPMMESQPSEAIKNNSVGTARLAEMASAAGVERFVMISTDKAVNPTNVMGASKRVAELFVQALQGANHTKTKFIAVRFGNVLGSSGSVVPTFTRQIAEGGPVTVTDPEMQRYFMTIPEAVGLVLQSATQGDGGEIFVLDMGKPVKIADMARQMIELSGLRPGVDIEIKYTGLRPGEKLVEELCLDGENYRPTNHPRIMRFVAAPAPIAAMRSALELLTRDLDVATPEELRLRLQQVVPEYIPYRPQEPVESQAPATLLEQPQTVAVEPIKPVPAAA